MSVESLLRFDGDASFSSLEQRFSAVVDDLCDVVMEHARANLKGEYPEVEITLRKSLSQMAGQGLIDGQVGAGHWMAFIAEWGSGSEMDTSNPDLQGYMESELWNPLRGSTTIVGRPPGQYMGLDGKIHVSSGKLAGRYIEHFILPKEPLHFMRDALEANRKLILDQLNGVIETFRFVDFFI